MSALQKNTRPPRPAALTWASVLLALGAVGATATLPLGGDVSAGFVIASAVFTAIGVIGAIGIWLVSRWGVWLSAALVFLNGLASAPGIVFAPDAGARVGAILGVLLMIIVLGLLFSPSARAAVRSNRRTVSTSFVHGAHS